MFETNRIVYIAFTSFFKQKGLSADDSDYVVSKTYGYFNK